MMNACRSFRIGRALTVGLVLIGVDMGAALGAGQAPHDAEECRSIRDDADRLACYDRANSATPAAAAMPDAAPVQAPTAAVPAASDPVAPPEAAPEPIGDIVELSDDIGREALDGKTGGQESITVRGRVVSCRKDLGGKYVFNFDNGQVWRQKDNLRLRWHECSFDVTITEDFFGYKMQPDGEDRKVRIGREQ